MADVVQKAALLKGLTLRRVAVDYTADSVSDLVPSRAEIARLVGMTVVGATAYYIRHNLNKYDASISDGVGNAETRVEAFASQCPHSQLVLAGYSQGAIAIHDAENWLKIHDHSAYNKIAATLLLGDGDRIANSAARRFGSSPRAGRGIRVYLRAVRAHEVANPATTAEICNDHDIVCHFRIGNFSHFKQDAKVHTTYSVESPKGSGNYSYSPILTNAAIWSSQFLASAPDQVGSSWTATQAPQPPDGGSNFGLGSVACVAADSCIAVGEYNDDNGDAHGLIDTLNNGAWTAKSAPVPQDAAGSVSLNDVSCDESAAACVAVGGYQDLAGKHQGLIETMVDGSWTPARAPIPAGAADDPAVSLESAACDAGGVCVAVGMYSDDQGRAQIVLDTRTNMTWQTQTSPLPVDAQADSSADVRSAACDDAGMCVAFGDYQPTIQSQTSDPLLLTWADSTWRAARLPAPADAATGTSPAWTSSTCHGPGSCIAVGRYQDSSGAVKALVESLSNTTWSTTALPIPSDASPSSVNAYPRSVACAEATCAIAGYYYTSSGHIRGLIETLQSAGWAAKAAPVPTDASGGTSSPTGSELNSAACVTAQTCVAVGDYQSTTGSLGLIERYVHGAWSPTSSPLPPDAETNPGMALQGVGCDGVSLCISVGHYYPGKAVIISSKT